jgi:hypothetical protein
LRSVGYKALHFLFSLITQGFHTADMPILAHSLVDYICGCGGTLVGRHLLQDFISQENLVISNHDDRGCARLVMENTMRSREYEDQYQADHQIVLPRCAGKIPEY